MEFRNVSVRLRIQKNKDDGEYRVAVFIDGKYQEGPTYYAMNKEDAEESIEWMGREFENGTYVDACGAVRCENPKVEKTISRVEWRA